MTWVLEQPIYILILGGLTFAFLGYAWWQTGYRAMFHAMLAVAALTAGLLILERLVVTDVEKIEDTLDQIARDVESNDLPKILSHVYSGATETYARAQREFPNYVFKRVDIKRNVEVVFDRDAQPPQAEVTFNVVVDVEEKSTGYLPRVARFVRVTMIFEKGQWRVAKYSHDDPQNSMLNPDR